MKVLLVGAHGVIGSAVARELGARHTLVSAGRSKGDVKVDITDSASIRRMFEQVGRVDAVVSAAGNVHFAPLEDMTEQHFDIGLRDKLMGQVNLAMIGRAWLNDGGSITLTGGILAEQPIRNGSSASLVNSALEGFVRGAAIELPRGLRINLVSPNVVQESLPQLAPFFRGFEAVPAARVALGYSRSVEGHQTGQIYRVF
ncbi:short chain dehydrogenase [Archangium minus]|uniref:Short chain dehydrogenase n=1 Tax=Archangium minus TaxID=83450 RepID=A0ABY9X9Q6_9BACT|nr:short chain dehydrogenase [Archangium minus]